MPQTHRAFTLVELMVLIAIIVLLLALLMPALDKAIYQAELAVCAAKLDAIASNSFLYAMDHKRWYPHRVGVGRNTNGVNGNWQPEVLANGNEVHDAAGRRIDFYDDRPLFNTFLPVNHFFNDPLTRAVNLDGSYDGVSVYGSYFYWAGWRYAAPRGGRGMLKIGDRFFFNDTASEPATQTTPARPRPAYYSVLACDRDWVQRQYGTQTSHPDRDGKLYNIALEGQDFKWELSGVGVSFKLTISTWRTDLWARSPIDMNLAYDDGGVIRFSEVEVDDDRMNALAGDELQTTYPATQVSVPRP